MTLSPHALQALSERVGQAVGPDRKLDEAIALATNQCEARGGFVYAFDEAGSTREFFRAPPYTASIDAALGLVERCLPERGPVGLTIIPGKGGAQASIDRTMDPCGGHSQATGANAPLAILSALLSALVQEQAS